MVLAAMQPRYVHYVVQTTLALSNPRTLDDAAGEARVVPIFTIFAKFCKHCAKSERGRTTAR
jgi:hypothetical protein